MTDRIVFLPELIETVGVSRTTINRWRAAGKLPEAGDAGEGRNRDSSQAQRLEKFFNDPR